MGRRLENIIGLKFGRLLVLENTKIKKHGATLYKCKCDCGNEIVVPNSYLKSGHTRSCGCLSKEAHAKHNSSNSRLYEIHQGMKKRCFNENCLAYKDYGGRGITICKEWLDFLTFKEWALSNGYDDTLTIERTNVNGNYEPSNCKWIAKNEQSRNTRKNVLFTFDGETKTLSEWSNTVGIPQTTLFRRIKQNRPIQEIFYKGDLKCLKKKKSC